MKDRAAGNGKRIAGEAMAFSLFFDAQDHELVRMVNDFLNRDKEESSVLYRIAPGLHPNGILQLTSSRVHRVAWALILLLNLSEHSSPEERLTALRRLREETQAFARTTFRYNTARVLVQLMKDILRNRDDVPVQLQLAHDFYRAATGKPRIVRALLKRYFLVEMPEDLSQRAFDHYVHDAYTSGRKSPTHLIMDAWVKGVNYLTVIYNFRIHRDGARELVRAAEIMGVTLRMGVKFRRLWRGRPVGMVWIPRGFSGSDGFFKFLDQPEMREMAEQGDAILSRQWEAYGPLIDEYNTRYRPVLNRRFGIEVPPLTRDEFSASVSRMHPSRIRFAECIHKRTLLTMKGMEPFWREAYADATEQEREAMRDAMREKNGFSPATVLQEWLDAAYAASGIETLGIPRQEENEPDNRKEEHGLPGLLRALSRLTSDYRAALCLDGMTPAEVLQLLYECDGFITHLEMDHPRDWTDERISAMQTINRLRENINSGNPVGLKHSILRHLETFPETACDYQCLRDFLHNIPGFMRHYMERPLGIFVGSGSSGRSDWGARYGMGFVVLETLPRHARKEQYGRRGRPRLPLYYGICRQEERIYTADETMGPVGRFLSRRFPLLYGRHGRKKNRWLLHLETLNVTKQGNIIALGGYIPFSGNMLSLTAPEKQLRPPLRITDLNTKAYDVFMILAGFIPAFATFCFTQEGPMRYLGAPLWFGITGLRNIIQAVVSGGGLYRKSHLSWSDYISWTRVSESLFYSGMAVPLLELGVRVLLLQHLLGLTADKYPFPVFLAMAAVNGLYIACHTIYRGLPRKSAYANAFRNILAIPLVMVYSNALGGLLVLAGLSAAAAGAVINSMAAVVSKTASNTMGGIIGGYFDRKNMMRLRFNDYNSKLKKLSSCQIRLELLFPYEDSFHMLMRPEKLLNSPDEAVRALGTELAVHALDLMYFWYYQPLAMPAARRILRGRQPQERFSFVRFQYILEQHAELYQLILSGLMGRRFRWALSFYLENSTKYLTEINRKLLEPGDRALAPALRDEEKNEADEFPSPPKN